jgi:hypothetical protein
MFSKKKTIEHLGFAEALEHSLGEKECKCLLFNYPFVNSTRAFSALILFLLLFFKTKKGGSDVFVWHFYGFFLSINRASTIATMMITTIMPILIGTKYMSATDVGVAVGATVTAGVFHSMVVCAVEL